MRAKRHVSQNTIYRRRRRLLVFVLLAVGLVAAALFLPGVGGPTLLPDSSSQADVPAMAQPVEPDALKFPGALAGTASLTDAYIYGTHLNLAGTLTPADPAFTGLQLVLRAEDGAEAAHPLQYATVGTTVTFTLSEQINGGLDLEALAQGTVCLLVRATGAESAADYLLTAGQAADLPFTYYTVTQNGQNDLIALQSQKLRMDGHKQEGLVLTCQAAQLPENVYDIVIDAGHGGTDGGAVAGDVCEATVMLDMALRLRDRLEHLGYKVLLTRNGTEDPTTKMAYTMYDEDGRVTLTAGSGAKLCLSLHLNTYEGYLEHGGVQIYAADRMDTAFAQSLAAGVAAAADTYISPMEVYKVAPGVYTRVFTYADSQELDAECAEFDQPPYNIPAGTNYYYIIRETGGRITGAYIDGRHPHYGTNVYRDSSVGVETYLCELGYISLPGDLKHILDNPDGYAQGLADAIHARFSE